MTRGVDVRAVERLLGQRAPADRMGDHRQAAVATVLRDGTRGAEVLLIRRAERDDDPWSGHMALPGGRLEPSDLDLLHTAIRETQEEVGLHLRDGGRLLGRLDDVPAIGRARFQDMVIRPFVFALVSTPELALNEEVAEAFWAPLAPLLAGSADATKHYQHEDQTFELPAYDVEGRLVWGLTYHMLTTLFRVLRGEP
jgi:8-oxo-dGTP pyrophosphatase MutT (NUDIX family)